MTSTALVLFMTLPGLALFYGGLVRKKNVLSVMAQCMGIAGLVTILWWLCGYSLAFGSGSSSSSLIGNLNKQFALFKGVVGGETGQGYHWISNNVWAIFQLTFAIITPALIIGAIAERMKFSAVLLFVAIWMFVVYFPFAHMVWATDGLMCGPLNPNATIKAIDFAGGTVVHMTSGWSALILCLILKPRLGFPKQPMPRTAWCFVWSAPACSGSVGMVSTPAARSGQTASPPTPSPPPRWLPPRRASCGR
jgi:Amt family ammonium transporter